jgi:anthranilate phosphoribosyltransferase
MFTVKSKEVIDVLNTTRYSKDFSEIYESLNKLRPDKLSTNTIIELVKYIEQNSYKKLLRVTHYNSFGTGGDKFKTINISTIASIIASNFVSIYKVGTKAVTSTWGSSDFIDALYSNLPRLPSSLRNKAFYQEGSGYFSLSDLGYPYSEILRKARFQLYQEGIPDIYKVIFPASNLTHSSGQVNGVYLSEYIKYFVDISIALERNTLIVHSTHGVDEIAAGRNLLVRISNGKLTESEVYLPDHDVDDSYYKFIAESPDIDEQLSKFINILKGNCPQDVILTVAYNVACILNLELEDIQLEFFIDKIIGFMKLTYNEQ